MKTTNASDNLTQATRLLRAFADPVRLRLLHLLRGREICVCYLHTALVLPQPTVSRHLAYLRKAGLVEGRREGTWIHYRLAPAASPLHQRLLDCLACCFGDVQLLEADRQRLERSSCC